MAYWTQCEKCGQSYIATTRHFCKTKPKPPSGLTAEILKPKKPEAFCRASRKQEARVANELGGKTVVASGALPGSGGDVKTDEYLVECKMTKHQQYTLKLATWFKIMGEAAMAGKTPMMELELDGNKLVVLSYAHFKDLIDA